MFEDLEFRERAYELWEKIGRPERSEQLYWRLAQEQLEAEAPLKPLVVSGPRDPHNITTHFLMHKVYISSSTQAFPLSVTALLITSFRCSDFSLLFKKVALIVSMPTKVRYKSSLLSPISIMDVATSTPEHVISKSSVALTM
ncbi:DUF2934 domain-containing protein [Pseudomonas helleri]|uniref:DUF2934 domain-containing protein n=1 Tax=Pseudomonas helleri TaxID=1608996 RepID=A0A7X2CJL0_9PSED|nr:DUF2934 domain-containing protein [Pseudomonas helleri]MQU33468.1 DUF2934 domain-containing protein [Pseudomonas helleri]